ncbi:hypothetical protein [Actinocorallia populi]|nr:hypothetical protein [Actinocorallia populi]
MSDLIAVAHPDLATARQAREHGIELHRTGDGDTGIGSLGGAS